MRRWTNGLITLGLIAGTFALYGRTAQFGFVNLDDGGYIYGNPHTRAGLNADTMSWAFNTGAMSNWHPLTWMSWMAEISIFGVNPGPMHLDNVTLHAINSALVFLVLLKLTGSPWPSAWAAAMFAWHPVHVESVAWITERKDTLSTLFLLLCLLAYLRYVAAPAPRWMSLTAVLLAVGLLAKAMLVTLPCVMLLLDWWPLRRMRTMEDARKLAIEKAPLFLIVVLSCVATYAAQSSGHAVASVQHLPVHVRVMNVIISYVRYLRMTLVPRNLAIFYPMAGTYPGSDISASSVAISGAILLLLTVGCLLVRKSHPWLLLGWLYYVGTLVPVIGFVQVGEQSHADRYTYVPLIGVFFAIAWEARYWIRRHHPLRIPVGIIAVATVGACCALTWRQIGYWRSAETVMRHAAEAVPSNFLAHACLGEALEARGDVAGAIQQYHEALAIKPDDAVANNNLALLAMKRGDVQEAIRLYKDAIFSDPKYVEAYNNYGNLLMEENRVPEAITVYRRGIARDPEFPQIYHNLALALAGEGKVSEAIPLWRKALELDPNYAEARANLGTALIITGQTRQGLDDLAAVLKTNPNHVEALRISAWTLATHPSAVYRDAAEAQRRAARVVELTHGTDPVALDTLAAAEARGGKFDDAIRDAQRAIDLVQRQAKPDLVAQIRKRLDLYQSHQPFTSGQ